MKPITANWALLERVAKIQSYGIGLLMSGNRQENQKTPGFTLTLS